MCVCVCVFGGGGGQFGIFPRAVFAFFLGLRLG